MKKPTPFGKYYLLERINIGGMAEVFRAKAFGVEGFERLVAVKRILPAIAEDKEFIRTFIEEAKLSVQLNHANIAQIFDLGVVEGSYYIALEHVHGRDLRVLFERCRQLGEAMLVAQACFVAMKVCEGLDYAHNKRDQAGRELALVHRDVSPPNILVSFEGEVKLIDFGIAKAAGAGAAQSGVRKGKFGYMSPEQVRGQELDRRSDVFACGVVLYELLTSERLFVGESDFDTLEKVRNVEILPPSTYNRKIPDELERIVLKALSKDAEERYQNAIDLHDELQAFVYTAGEFYSRKDLAAWMKKTFGKEIEDETAKLESYRQLKPPPPAAAPTPPPVPTAEGSGGAGNAVPAVVAGQSPSGKLPARKQSPSQVPPQGQNANPGQPAAGRTTTQPVAAIKPPPAPARPQPVTGPPPVSRPAPATGPHPVSRPAPATGPHPVLRPAPVTGPPPTVARSAPVTGPQPTVARSAAVTGPHPVSRSAPVAVMPPSVPVPAPPPGPSASIGSGVAAMAAMPLPAPAGEPQRYQRPVELGWEDDELETRVYDDKEDPRNKSGRANLPLQPPVSSSPSIPLPTEIGLRSAAPAPGELPGWGSAAPPVESFPVAPQSGAGSGGYRNGASAAPAFSVGANELGTPPPDLAELAMPSRREPPRGGGPTFGADMPTIPVTSFGARITGRRPSGAPNRLVMAAVGGAAIIAVVAVLVIALSGGKPTTQSGPTVQVKAPPPLPPPDPSTGFDLYVAPAGITQWKLDGESRTDRLPSRIRGISPGPHTVQIEPPPGFLSQHQEVMVEAGKAPKVEIALQPIPGMSGVFESEPAGAMVSLIIDGKRQTLGPSPATSPLDPRNGYQVLFEKPGYVSINRPITFSAALEQHIVVNLEKVAPGTPTTAAPAQSPAPHAAPPEPRQRRAGRSDADSSDAGDAAERGAKQGVLVLGSKPPCDIAIDGSSTGLHTPQKEIKLPVGRHRITLSNPEFSINETFTVDIKADAPEKLIKDYSDRLP